MWVWNNEANSNIYIKTLGGKKRVLTLYVNDIILIPNDLIGNY
jgi:hypothetical protein